MQYIYSSSHSVGLEPQAYLTSPLPNQDWGWECPESANITCLNVILNKILWIFRNIDFSRSYQLINNSKIRNEINIFFNKNLRICIYRCISIMGLIVTETGNHKVEVSFSVNAINATKYSSNVLSFIKLIMLSLPDVFTLNSTLDISP